MVVRDQLRIPRVPDARHASRAVGKVEGGKFQPARHAPDGEHDGGEDGAALHRDDSLPALAAQQRRVGEHTCDDLHDDAERVLPCGVDVDVVDGVVLGFEPEGEGGLLGREAGLNEEVAEG